MSRGLVICALFCLVGSASVPAAGQLLGHWPLEEVIDGVTLDASGNGNDLVAEGGVRLIEGYYGQAASFDGQDANGDALTTVADNDLFDPGAGSFTVTAWVKQEPGDSSQAYEFMVSKGNATSGNVGWSIWTESGSLLVRCNSSNTSAQRASQRLADWPAEEWAHVALVLDREAAQVRGYLNGSDEGWVAGGGGPTSDSLAGWGDIDTDLPLAVGHRSDGQGTLLGAVDDVRIYAAALTVPEIEAAMKQIGKGQASAPTPDDEATDVPYDAVLTWEPGEFAAAHDVYFGTSFTDVNEADRTDTAGLLASEGQTASTYDPGTLDFGQTYYWRIDEVNGAPDYSIYKGVVWSFETEPVAYPIEHVTATAASSGPDAGPENTVNGSGLDENGLHSTESSDMWLSDGQEPATIEFAFDRLYKLHAMLVWNYNVEFESILGYGVKDVTIEYSENSVDWLVLGDFEFTQAISGSGYGANTTIDFGGLAAQAVRLTVNDNWGTMATECGLSEVRFLHTPVQAREPQPADEQTEVDVDTALSWRAGREAVTHEVYLGTDSGGVALVDTVDAVGWAPTDLQLGATYYWRVDEVNDAEAVPLWEGDLWQFTVQEFVTLDDFERYNDDDDRIYDTWVDGWVNGTSATVGYFEEPFAEMSIVHGGRQAMPLEYINANAPYYAEAQRDLGGTDLTASGADALRFYVYGNTDNDPETLYVALEDMAGQVAVVAHTNEAVLTTAAWQEWVIPFTSFGGIDPAAVRTVTLGVGDPENPTVGGAGLVFVDDIGYGHPAATE